MNLTSHCTLLNWLPKLDSSFSVKVHGDNVKVRRRANMRSKVNSNSVHEFISFLTKTSDQVRTTEQLSSVMKKFPKLDVLLHELMKYPHLMKNSELQLGCASLFDSYLTLKTQDENALLLTRRWCFENLKKLVYATIYNKNAINSQLSVDSKNIQILENVDNELVERAICDFLDDGGSNSDEKTQLLKIVVILCNSFDSNSLLRFDTLFVSIRKAVSDLSFNSQQKLFELNRCEILDFPAEFVADCLINNFLAALTICFESNQTDPPFQRITDVTLTLKNKPEAVILQFCTELVKRLKSSQVLTEGYFISNVLKDVIQDVDGNLRQEIEMLLLANFDSICAKAMLIFLYVDPACFDSLEAALEYLDCFRSDFTAAISDVVARILIVHWAFWIMEVAVFNEVNFYFTEEVFRDHEIALQQCLLGSEVSNDDSDRSLLKFHQFRIAARKSHNG